MCVKKEKKTLLTLGSIFSCQQVKRPFGFCQHSPHRKVDALETWLTRISEPCDPSEREEPFGNNRKRGKACLGKQGKGFSLFTTMERNEECMSVVVKATQCPLGLITWTLCSDDAFLFSGKHNYNGLKTNLAFFVRGRSWRSAGQFIRQCSETMPMFLSGQNVLCPRWSSWWRQKPICCFPRSINISRSVQHVHSFLLWSEKFTHQISDFWTALINQCSPTCYIWQTILVAEN